MKLLRTLLILLLCTALGGMLAWSMLTLPGPSIQLAQQVEAQLDATGVSHPVTAVLLNTRAYDTLLEVAVLLLALLGVLAGTSIEGRRPVFQPWPGLPILRAFARLLAPLTIMVAGYLLWAGSHRPGGAFQAGAVLAGAGVLLHLARLLPAWATPQFTLRCGLAGGFLVFLCVAALSTLPTGSSMLQYRGAGAGTVILLIESGLTLSIGLLLTGLFLFLSIDGMEHDATEPDR